MEIALRNLVNSVEVLNKLNNIELPIKFSYELYKDIKNINVELDIYNEKKSQLISKYALKDENGDVLIDSDKTVQLINENIDLWNKEINELLDIIVNIDIVKLDLNELINSNCSISPAELKIVEYLILE